MMMKLKMVKVNLSAKKILIAYGTRYGSTEEISHKIRDFFKENTDIDTDIDILNFQIVNKKKWPSVVDYDGILIGTGIRMGKWIKEAEDFMRKCKNHNENGNIILGIFVTCGYAADPKYYPVAIKDFIQRITKKAGIEPDIYDAFGGVFDYSKKSKKNFMNKTILKWGARDLDLNIQKNVKNDFRNWEKIKKFTGEFVALLIKD